MIPTHTFTRPILHLPRERFEQGRVLVVGDLHGCFDLLTQALSSIRFNPANDTLICVGDLVDRGPNSARCVQLLKEPYVFAIRGNHEDMLLQAQYDKTMLINFVRNGGQWWFEESESAQQEILDLISELPIAIEADSPLGPIGFVHAEVPLGMSWQEFVNNVQDSDDHTIVTALWGRQRITKNDEQGVDGIYRLFVGHTPTYPRRLGNIYPVDTGAVYGAMGAESPEYHLSVQNVLTKTERLLTNTEVHQSPHGNFRLTDE